MRKAALVVALCLTAAPALAQTSGEIEITPLEELDAQQQTPEGTVLSDDQFQTFEQDIIVAPALAGFVRVLDKLTGRVETMEIAVEEPVEVGLLSVTLHECRFPVENPASDAFARMTIKPAQQASDTPLFRGWMIASSPALMALDHPRYDIWVTRCKFREGTPEVADGTRSPRPRARP